jgi:hypothetical protein
MSQFVAAIVFLAQKTLTIAHPLMVKATDSRGLS